MAKVYLRYNFSAVAQDVIIVWYENSSPGAEVGRWVLDDSLNHEKDGNHTADDLNPVMHIFKFYQSSDGSTLETLLISLSVDASIYNEVVVDRFQYKVGRGQSGTDPDWADPADNDTQILDERIAGATYDTLEVNMRSTGPRSQDEFNIIPAGGIELQNPEVFIQNDWIFITLYKIVAQQVSGGSGSGSSDYNDINVVDANGNFDDTYYKKINISAGVGTILTTTFPDFSLIPNTKAKFCTFGGSQRYWKLQFNAGDMVTFMGANRNVIYLGKNESLELIWKDGACYAAFYAGEYHLVGQRVLADNKSLQNSHLADGTESDIADYPRLYAALLAEQIVSYASYDLSSNVTIGSITKEYFYNRGKFAVDVPSGKFKWPDMRGQSMRVLKYFDATADTTRLSQLAGGMQAQNLIAHKHLLNYREFFSDESESGTEGKGLQDKDDGDGALLDTETENTPAAATGIEQAVDNIGQYCLIKI